MLTFQTEDITTDQWLTIFMVGNNAMHWPEIPHRVIEPAPHPVARIQSQYALTRTTTGPRPNLKNALSKYEELVPRDSYSLTLLIVLQLRA